MWNAGENHAEMLPVIAKDAGMDEEATAADHGDLHLPNRGRAQLSEAWLGGNAQTFMKGVADVFVAPVPSTARSTAMKAREHRPAGSASCNVIQALFRRPTGGLWGAPGPLFGGQRESGEPCPAFPSDNMSMRFDLPNGGHVQALEGRLARHQAGRVDERAGPVGLRQDHAFEHRGGLSGPDRRQIVMNGHEVTGRMRNAAWCFSRARCSNG